MSYENNPLEKLPSSRGGAKERSVYNDSEYKGIVDKELDEDVAGDYEKKYVKRTRIDLEGKELPGLYNTVEAIPDDRLLPDQFEDEESGEDKERDDYVEEYNKQHEGQYEIKLTDKKISDNVEKVPLVYNNAHGKVARNNRRMDIKRKAA
jgi:hypothetical protein